jgi:tetratricopeptide (TPR) repeat protein
MMRILSIGAGVLLLLGAGHARAARGERYALLVGVKQYDRSELTPLSFTENDVTVLAELLKVGGYKRVVLLTQTRGAFEARYLPTAANIRRELKGLLEDRTAQDTVVVGFCGHGVQFAGSDEPYFCPMDTKLKDKKTLLSLGEVYGELKECKASVKVLLSDACRNDPLPGGKRAALGSNVFAPTKAERRKPPENVVALFSCSAGEAAFESKDLKHGVFFHYLIQGLRGKAAQGRDKAVTLASLTDYVQREVRDFVKEEVGAEVRQRPELVGRFGGPVTLMEVSRAVQTTDPGEIKNLIDRGLVEIRANDFGKVVATMNEALKLSGDSAIALAMRAHAYDYLGEPKKAMADANQALKLEPNLAAAYFTRGNVYLTAGNPRKAVAEFTQALKRNPKHLAALFHRGRAHALLRNAGRAIEDYTELLRLNPRYAAAYHARGLAHAVRRKYDDALEDFNRAIEIDPRHAAAYADRALLHYKRGENDEALQDCNKAIGLNRDLASAYHLRGNIRIRRKEYDKAVADLSEAIQKREDYTAAMYDRGRAFLLKKDYRKAIGDFDDVLRSDERHAEAYYSRGVARYQRGEYDKAVADCTRAIEVDAADARFFGLRGQAYRKLGQKQKAAEDLARAKKLGGQQAKKRSARR